MKRALIFFCLVAICQILLAQAKTTTGLQNVTNICYDEAFTEHIRITGDLNTSTLTTLEKLKFIDKSYVQKHHEYINSSGFSTHDRSFVSHENMFPKWYSHPTLIRNDETGITSYFSTENEFLPDGWTGGVVPETQHGTYMTNGVTGQKYYQEGYSPLANDFYSEHDSLIKSIGFLYKTVFKTPDATVLQQMENGGFQTNYEGNVITVQNASTILLWDLEQMVFATQKIEGGKPVKTTRAYFTYHASFDAYLISQTTTVIPAVFENGDCYETVFETTFTNYAAGCGQSSTDFIINENSANITGALSIYPNPADNSLTVRFPASDVVGTIKLFDLSGKVMVHRKVGIQSTKYQMDISHLPKGMYMVKMLLGNEILSSKFVKQ